ANSLNSASKSQNERFHACPWRIVNFWIFPAFRDFVAIQLVRGLAVLLIICCGYRPALGGTRSVIAESVLVKRQLPRFNHRGNFAVCGTVKIAAYGVIVMPRQGLLGQ